MISLLKTSDEWAELLDKIVFDPDGWDRKNFYYSWYEEKITREEFRLRLSESTVMYTGKDRTE